MKTFKGDPKLKEDILQQLKAHYKADEIVKGQYWENGKGCAVGCTVHSSNHLDYKDILGSERNCVLAHLEDSIFEALPNKEAKEFPIQFIEAIPVGVCLDSVFYKFFALLLKRAVKHVNKEQEGVYKDIIKLFEDESKDISAWRAVRYAAEDAAEDAAWDAAWYAARYATGTTGTTGTIQQRDDLLTLLKEAK